MYNKVSVEIHQIDEYSNEFFYNRNGDQINIDDINNTSESDLESEGSQEAIESDSEIEGVQNDVIKTVVFDGVRVQVIVLLKDDSNDDIDFLLMI